jgi:4-hydroxybenzoate polyprenyltransferase
MKNRLVSIGQEIMDFLLYGNIFIALCAAFQTWMTCRLLYIDMEGKPLTLFVFAATFFIYNIHKPITFFLKKDFINNERFLKTKAYAAPLSIMCFIAAMICLDAFFRFSWSAQYVVIGLAIFSLAYVLPILPLPQKGVSRLKDLPYIKIFVIALVWSVDTIALPIVQLRGTLHIVHYQMMLERAAFVFALTIPFDIRDMVWDKATDVKTIPLSIGIKKAKLWANIALIISLSMSYIFLWYGIYTFKSVIVLFFSYILSAYWIQKTSPDQPDHFFDFNIDGMLFLQAILVIFVQNML